MTKFCPECGFKQHSDNNRYCSNCGFDFSKIGNNIGSTNSDNSRVNVPISDGSVSKPVDSVSNGSISPKSTSSFSKNHSNSNNEAKANHNLSSKVDKNTFSKADKNTSSKAGKNTSAKTKANNNSTNKIYKTKTNSDSLLSNLTFNKCFLAFAVLMVILLIAGMLSQATQGPYSDGGITSFMERSDYYDLNDFLEETNYSNDDSYDYLKYGGDGESDIPFSNSIW